MPIKFYCPHCKRGLSVKDHLAGKRAACPACKKALTIPKSSSTTHAPLRDVPARPAPPPAEPPPVPHADAEAAAAEALSDEPSAAPKKVKTVDFNCPSCDAELKIDAELAGKKTSCPECRRIIKVPDLAPEDVKDWRKSARSLPSGAKGADVPEPEGAWGSARAQHVSRDALLEAAVLPDRKIVPLTLRQKITRGIVYGVIGVSAVAACFIVYFWVFGSSEQRALNGVLAVADADDPPPKVGRNGVAVLDLATGAYYVQTHKEGSAAKAKGQFEKALKQLKTGSDAAGDSERDGVLIDLAAAAADLAGTKQQADDGQKLDDKESQKLLRAVLEAIHEPAARLEALRLVTRRLVAARQAQRALNLAAQVFSDPVEQSAAVATVCLELSAAGETDLANAGAKDVFVPFTAAEGKTAPPAPAAVIALAALLKRDAPKGNDDALQAAQAEGAARQGKIAEALASVREAKSGPERTWMLLRLVREGADAGADANALRSAADALPEPLKARGHLLILRGRLAHDAQPTGDDALSTIHENTASHLQARVELARHNTRTNSGYAKTVRGWDEQYRPFGVIGTLLK
jgi:hypothetical protein